MTPLRSFVSRCSFALCRERTHQGDGKPSPQEKTRMHTRNVNVKTAAQESSRKMGEGQNLAAVARERVAGSINLKKGVTVTIAEVDRYGDVQVEIRTNGLLNWRAWSFEPDFIADLDRNLRYVEQK
ncbi:TPA: hypothetical protein ACG1H7_004655 [Citrobacter freundii]